MVDKDVEINKKEKILLICNTEGYTISIEKQKSFFLSLFLSLEYPTPKKEWQKQDARPLSSGHL